MARPAVELLGSRELRRTFRQMARELGAKGLDKVADAGAEVVQDEARRRAPRGRTHRLARSIERAKDPVEPNTPGRMVVGPGAGTKASRREGFWGLFLERGTKGRVTKSGRRTGRVRATHWLQKSFNGSISTARTAMAAEARRQVSAAARRSR